MAARKIVDLVRNDSASGTAARCQSSGSSGAVRRSRQDASWVGQPYSAAGAIRMLAIGAGGLEVAPAIAGELFSFEMPLVWGIKLAGSHPDWVWRKMSSSKCFGVTKLMGRRDASSNTTDPGWHHSLRWTVMSSPTWARSSEQRHWSFLPIPRCGDFSSRNVTRIAANSPPIAVRPTI